MTRPPPTSTLFPYTTLFRSRAFKPEKLRAKWSRAVPPFPNCFPISTTPAKSAENWTIRKQFGKGGTAREDRKSTRLNSSHSSISYAVFCLKKKKTNQQHHKS